MRLTAQQKIEIAEAIERIAFLPAQPEPKREEPYVAVPMLGFPCANCGQQTLRKDGHVSHRASGDETEYYCDKPSPSPDPVDSPWLGEQLESAIAQNAELPEPLRFKPSIKAPAPVAIELPEAVTRALYALRNSGGTVRVTVQEQDFAADALESWARSQVTAQPVAVGMTPELELVLFVALHTVNHDKGWTSEYAEKVRAAIAAVRAQAASAKPGRDLPKVRNALGLLRSLLTRYASQIDYAKERMGIASAALAELDASAQPWRDLPNVRAYLNKRRIDNGEDMVSPGFEASINKDVRMLRAALAELDAQPKAVEVPVEAIRRVVDRSTWPCLDEMTHSAINEVVRWLAAVEWGNRS